MSTQRPSSRTHEGVQAQNALVADGLPHEVQEETPDLSGLSEAEREVFVSCDLEGLRAVELAKHTKWSESTIRTLLSRAREKMEGQR